MAEFNVDLLDDLAKRKVVLFVGAGASKSAKPRNGGTFKGWQDFLINACDKISDQKIKKTILARIKSKDYLIASEILKENLEQQWIDILSTEFQQSADTSRLHKALINLDQRIIITTNFDKLIETAWGEHSTARYPNVISDVDNKVFRLFRNDDPYIIKIHGTIDSPEKIIFDKTSYQREAFANEFYRDLIGTLLLTHTFLFIGFSMDDPAISSILESHAFRFFDSRPHYIFASGKPEPIIDDLSKKIRKLFVMKYSSANHHIALVESLESLAQHAAERKRIISTPTVTSVVPQSTK